MQRVGTRDSVEIWEKTLAALRSIATCKDKLDEAEKMVNHLTAEIAESSRRGILNNPADVYDQLCTLARLSTTIGDLRRGLGELESLEKKLHAIQKRIEMDFMIMEQIREQLKKKFKIIADKSSEIK